MPEPRRLDDFWTPIDPRDVLDGWLLLRNSRLGPQERAATLSATCGDTSYSKVSEKLRSQWSDADLAQHDRHGKSRSHDGLGSANLVDLSEVDDERSTHEQLSEFPDGVFEVTARTTRVNSGTSTKRVSNETKTMCSLMTSKKSSR